MDKRVFGGWDLDRKVSTAFSFLFGSGPVKGFAVTLTFGLAANLFTAVFVSRVIFDAHVNKLKPGELVSI